MIPQRIYIFCFFLSGVAGLVYQVAWVRALSLVFGNTVYAVSMVVAGFLAGLALGSFYWGKKIDGEKRPLSIYVKLEAGIALFSILVTFLIYIVDDTIASMMTPESIASGGWQALRFVIIFLILLIPTTLMGGTLPVMSKFLTTSADKIGFSIGSLYAFNTYGGMAGAFLSGFLFLPLLGLWGTVLVAVALNLFIAAILLGPSAKANAPEADIPEDKKKKNKKKKKTDEQALEKNEIGRAKYTPALALTFIALSGFSALAFEVLWTRAFVVSFKSTVYLFSNLLTVFLLGMALGSHVFRSHLDKLKDPLKLFGLTQVGIAVFGMASVLFFAYSHPMALGLSGMFTHMSFGKDIFLMFVLMLGAFLIPTFLMGVAYPVMCRIAMDSLDTLGARAGSVYSVGTIGGIIGSLSAGFFMLPTLGLQNSLFVVSGIALVTGYAALLNSESRKSVGWVFSSSAFLSLLLFIGVSISDVNIGIGSVGAGKVIMAREGVMGTVKITQKREGGPKTLLVNNYQLATGGDVAVRFGHVPLIIKPDTKDVLLISLGSGITASSISAHPVDRIDCVEIVPELFDVQPYFEKDNHKVIADPRFHLYFWDGRNFVKVAKRKYDMVISDLFQPDSAGVGSLYTIEHFRNVKAKLKKGGAMAQWLPLYQLSPENLKVIMRTFAEVFEYVSVWNGDINSEMPALLLMGSQKPFSIRPDRLANTLSSPKVREDMIESNDPLSFLSFYVMGRDGVMKFTAGSAINTDNMPVVEYTAPKNLWQRRINAVENFKAMINVREQVTPIVMGAEGDKQIGRAIARYYKGRKNIMTGKVEHSTRDYTKEFESYKKAYKSVPSDPFLSLAVFDLGYLYYYRRDFNTSARLLKWSKEINPDLPEAHFYLAKSYQALGKADEALEVLKGLAKLRPDLAGALLQQKR
ncbi:hypothetical protein MNBD_NITROSPINAE01-1817 [hydrothermal vent metagenome]|uniref:PABS domain-containing protein n=1 Tax=hydrothermal vent metagenome TaxID=652676 RepID=A0A3B1CQ67_9ZZZZ